MSSFAKGGVSNNVAKKLMELEEVGVINLGIRNKGTLSIVAAYIRASTGLNILNLTDLQITADAVFDGDSLVSTPIAPGSIELTSSGVPTLKDRDRDGKLYFDRVVGSVLASGTDGVTSVPSTRTLTSATGDFINNGVVAGDELVITGSQDRGIFTILTVTATVLTLDANFTVGSLTTVPYSVTAKDVQAGIVNYFTGLLNLSYPTSPAAASPANKGTVLGTEAFPINLNPADTLIIDIDVGGDSTATFDAAAATIAGSGGVFAAMASETMDVRFRTGGTWTEWFTITFATEATLQLAIDQINAQSAGGYAVDNAGQVDLVSDGLGTGSQVETRNVAAGVTTKLGIPNTTLSAAGTGDVSNINAVTFAEAKTVIEADIADTLVTLDDTGGMRVTSDSANEDAASSVNVNATSTAEAKFGLDTTLHTGADADARQAISGAYIQSTLIQSETYQQQRVVGRKSDLVEVYFAANGGVGEVNVEVQSPLS
jgi:hypothetical protein